VVVAAMMVVAMVDIDDDDNNMGKISFTVICVSDTRGREKTLVCMRNEVNKTI
jgi:hypothetical protein